MQPGSLKRRLRAWRRRAKAALPFVRRREHAGLLKRYDSACATLAQLPPLACETPVTTLHRQPRRHDELCLFVTHAGAAAPKSHVLSQLRAFAGAGFDVVLVCNSDLAPDALHIADDCRRLCREVHVRANLGLDFAAWSQAAQLTPDLATYRRVVLANDSVIGPTSQAAFDAMLVRLRASRADVVGLTESFVRRRHLQSYFLAFQHRAVEASGAGDSVLRRMLAQVRNLPTKELVIDVYETRFTELLSREGLACEALFPALTPDDVGHDDSTAHWDELLQRGFPYLKLSVLRRLHGDPRLRSLVPHGMLDAWMREQPGAPDQVPPA